MFMSIGEPEEDREAQQREPHLDHGRHQVCGHDQVRANYFVFKIVYEVEGFDHSALSKTVLVRSGRVFFLGRW
jgi:hypothetical protein